MINTFIEFMKFSPSIVLTLAVMTLLVIALIILAFFLGNQYAIFNLAKSIPQHTPVIATSTEPAEIPQLDITLPTVPRNHLHSLDTWLRKTVLHATPLKFNEPVVLAFNNVEIPQGAVAENNEVYLYFVDVVYDSRCPANADCIGEGEAIVEMQLQKQGKSTKTFYLSTYRGGEPHLGTYVSLENEERISPEIRAEIARAKEIVAQTTYMTGDTYKSGVALVDGYIVSLEGLTPRRMNMGDPSVSKEAYRVTLKVRTQEGV